MKTILAALLVTLLLPVGTASAHRSRRALHAHRALHAPVRLHPASPPSLAEGADEVELSPALLKQLQGNLAAAGYLDGTVDGRLTHRTRRALAAFQRDYHMAPTGALDLATAQALLGYETLSAYLLARK